MESISDIIIQVDPEGVICFANRSVSSLGYEVDNLIGKRFSEIFDGKLGDIRKHHILTRRVGLRATINMEVSLKVNPLSSLHGLIWYLPFLVNTSGMWNVPQEIVLKKGATKEFLGSLLIARTDKKGLIV